VAQLYASFPGSKVERAAISLLGFKRIFIPRGETAKVTIPLNADDMRYWDTVQHKWVLEPGKVKISIGSSSTDIRLEGEIEVK
jgi:beta-glucosidase